YGGISGTECRHDADRHVQPRVHRGFSAWAGRSWLCLARTPAEERARRDRAERAARDGVDARLSRVALDPGRAAPADADKIQLPAAVGPRVLGERGVQG